MQYDASLSDNPAELLKYWSKPFSAKPELGFYSWPKTEMKLRLADPEDEATEPPTAISASIVAFFNDPIKLEKYIALNTIENRKGEDHFNQDKGLFYSGLFDQMGHSVLEIFVPHIKRLAKSGEEADQRFAAEVVYGMIRGSRFWSYKSTVALWEDVLIPVFKVLLHFLKFIILRIRDQKNDQIPNFNLQFAMRSKFSHCMVTKQNC
jgi:hypothetical protein